MTHELLAAARSDRVRIAIGRASDLFGAEVTQSTRGEQIFSKAVACRRADLLSNPDLLHTYSYLPEVRLTGRKGSRTVTQLHGQCWAPV